MLRQEDIQFNASLGYRMKTCLKKTKRSQVQWLMAVIAATWKAEMRR
jgi:hypothetical protein